MAHSVRPLSQMEISVLLAEAEQLRVRAARFPMPNRFTDEYAEIMETLTLAGVDL